MGGCSGEYCSQLGLVLTGAAVAQRWCGCCSCGTEKQQRRRAAGGGLDGARAKRSGRSWRDRRSKEGAAAAAMAALAPLMAASTSLGERRSQWSCCSRSSCRARIFMMDTAMDGREEGLVSSLMGSWDEDDDGGQ